MTAPWTPFREPLRATLIRTVSIAVVVGGIVSTFRGGLAVWPLATLVVFWPSFGGHWLDVCFLNWLRPRIPADRGTQIAARLGTWFVGGVAFGLGMAVTAMTLANFPPARWPAWWLAGIGFVGVELVAQGFLQLRRRPNFFNGRG